tara:strand:+ start:8522 stop:8968 length:447 start_codon:yes stop_codon:yes gene_type:complete
MYDKNTTKNRNVLIQKPATFVLDPVNENRLYRSAGPNNINNDTELRMKPTRLNYFNRPQTELFGTAPNQTLGHYTFTDIESKLRDGEDVNTCNKQITETYFRPHDVIEDPILSVDSTVRPISTRADLRNSYCNVNSRAHDLNTHIIKN